ncbi:MAG: hypothetical protein R2715_21055 [Ilumatobacteraceae bacterium]
MWSSIWARLAPWGTSIDARCTPGETSTAVTLYSGQFVAQSLNSVVTRFAPLSG